MLLEPTEKYVNFIENSKHFLNCPKHMFNHDIDCLYRQGIAFSEDKAIEFVTNHLLYYGFKKPRQTAVKWVKWRDNITTQEFNKINVNSYIDYLPPHTKQRADYIDQWTEAHTKYLYGNPVHVPSFPYQKR